MALSAENIVVTVAPLSTGADELESRLVSQLASHPASRVGTAEHRPFWQHPRWWKLFNQHLFNDELELIVVSDAKHDVIAATPVHRSAGLLQAPQHPHLTIGDSLWCTADSASDINDVMGVVMQRLKAWGWQSANAPDISQVRLCDDHKKWQWRKVRDSAWFDTSGEVPIPGKLRRNLSRHERHLESNGELHYERVNSDDPQHLADAMAEFLQLEASGWKGSSGTAITTDAGLKNFYEGLLTFNTDDLQLEIHRLQLGPNCLASQIALRCGSTRYLIKIAYDESHAAHSPGSLLLWRTLQASVSDNTTHLSLVTAPDWASRWKPQTFPVWHVTCFSNDFQGNVRQHLFKLREDVKDQLRKTRNRMRS